MFSIKLPIKGGSLLFWTLKALNIITIFPEWKSTNKFYTNFIKRNLTVFKDKISKAVQKVNDSSTIRHSITIDAIQNGTLKII